ncbi:MAG: hypothetical protein CML29_17920 [Rhizobiales bacterium]|nr:hypothetical protein [Hyphomicrobiales bacterium]MBA69630.1 hypothetical protein [Hyphomicrobiales bacterium]|tara:strand:+ start:266 stop:955 length:690 start_codon:yes stop_codon:yes gene_type:complete
MTQADVSAPAMAADGQPVTVPLFSAGSRKEPVSFGQRGAAAGSIIPRPADMPRAVLVYGTDLQRWQLGEFYRELRNLFADPVARDAPLPFHFDAERRFITIGRTATIRFDATAANFAFTEYGPKAPMTRTVRHPDGLMDLVLDHLARFGAPDPGRGRPDMADQRAVRTIRRMELSRILTMLRRCCGNRARTSRLLGLPQRDLRQILEHCWRQIIAVEPDVSPANGETVR